MDNYPDFAYFFIISTILSEQQILTINISLIFEVITSHFLDILPPNSNFITVYNCIYLLLLLN